MYEVVFQIEIGGRYVVSKEQVKAASKREAQEWIETRYFHLAKVIAVFD